MAQEPYAALRTMKLLAIYAEVFPRASYEVLCMGYDAVAQRFAARQRSSGARGGTRSGSRERRVSFYSTTIPHVVLRTWCSGFVLRTSYDSSATPAAVQEQVHHLTRPFAQLS